MLFHAVQEVDLKKETLDKLHRFELEILDEIDRVCHENNLRYDITAGTLLGAVRHGGFIPWDDDLDIVMPRTDYEKFLKICNDKISPRFYCQSRYNCNYLTNNFAKVRAKNTVFVEGYLDSLQDQTDMGIFVDIFPLDNAKKEKGIQQAQKFLVEKFTVLYFLKCGLRPDLPKAARIPAALFTRKGLWRIRHGIATLNKNDKAGYYINLGSKYNIRKQTIAKKHFGEPVRLKFEDREYDAPCDYLYILEHIYGKNYMELPPVEKRVTHDPVRLSFDLTGPDEELN